MAGFINPVDRFRGSNFGFVITEGKTARAFKSYLRTDVHRAGMRWVKESYGLSRGMNTFGRVFGLGYLGYSAYSGYQEGGVSGAIKNIATDAALTYGIRAGLQLLKVPAAGALALAGAGGFMFGLDMLAKGESPLEYFSKPLVNEYSRKRARLELGAPVYDPFGTVSTMRQRSVNAMNNSRFNGRTAMGQEAALLFSPYFR